MTADLVLYETRGPVAVVTMNRDKYRNAQNAKMTYDLDKAFVRAINDDAVKVIVLAGAGKHLSQRCGIPRLFGTPWGSVVRWLHPPLGAALCKPS